MPIRLSRFEMPHNIEKKEGNATGTYARFVAEPFEIGYARTIGNSLRRVLLSSIEGCAISSVKIAGVHHEFSTIKGCAEDVTDIILNLKRVLLKSFTREVSTISLKKKGPCTVYAGDFAEANSIEVLNPRQVICTLEEDGVFEIECELKTGRGFCLADANKAPEQEIGRIAIDSIFSPVTRVNFLVENTRVGNQTDFDKLTIDMDAFELTEAEILGRKQVQETKLCRIGNHRQDNMPRHHRVWIQAPGHKTSHTRHHQQAHRRRSPLKHIF